VHEGAEGGLVGMVATRERGEGGSVAPCGEDGGVPRAEKERTRGVVGADGEGQGMADRGGHGEGRSIEAWMAVT
jgi:hypothetical protein